MAFADPLDLFRAAVTAVQGGDFLAVARLADPVSLRTFQRQLLQQFAPAVPQVPPTAEDLMQSSPDMPRAVAEYRVSRRRELVEHEDPAQRLPRELPGIASLEVLRSLDSAEVFAAWLDGRSLRRQVQRIRDAGGATPAMLAAADQLQVQTDRWVGLGVVHDGAHVAYVAYRSHLDHTATDSDRFAEHLATLPDDEQQLLRETHTGEEPRMIRCRRQADGSWLLLAEEPFLSQMPLFVTISSKDDSDTAPLSADAS
jgi:hypothetical protein